MGKFSKAGGREMPELNTSSLPDLVFAFLFFIMMVTSMREVTLKVQFKAPQATELQKLEKKSLVTFIYVGKPTPDLQKKFGSETRIQLNDQFAETSEIQSLFKLSRLRIFQYISVNSNIYSLHKIFCLIVNSKNKYLYLRLSVL